MTFSDRLAAAVAAKQSSLCVGLDPRIELLPPAVIGGLSRAGPVGPGRTSGSAWR